jgi:hypothetical protein
VLSSGPELDYVVRGNTVSHNTVTTADREGGGMTVIGAGYAEPNVHVEDNIVTENLGGNGGGIWAEGVIVKGNTITHNEGHNGGGVYATSSVVEDNYSAFNTARVEGGGLFAHASTVKGNTVIGNSALGAGGLHAEWSMVADNVVSDNRAEWGAGGVLADTCNVISNTIALNSTLAERWTAAGLEASHHHGSEYDVLYNTIVGNMAPPALLAGGVRLSGPAQMHHNLIYGNGPYDGTVISSNDVSGTLNYWGTVDLMEIGDQIYDWHDDSYLGRLFFYPILEDGDATAPVPPPVNFAASWQDSSVALSWDAIPSTSASYSYTVYYDSDGAGPPYDGTGLDQGDSPIDVGGATGLTLTGLEEGTAYYVAVAARDELGREGWYSLELNNLALLVHRVYLPIVVR